MIYTIYYYILYKYTIYYIVYTIDSWISLKKKSIPLTVQPMEGAVVRKATLFLSHMKRFRFRTPGDINSLNSLRYLLIDYSCYNNFTTKHSPWYRCIRMSVPTRFLYQKIVLWHFVTNCDNIHHQSISSRVHSSDISQIPTQWTKSSRFFRRDVTVTERSRTAMAPNSWARFSIIHTSIHHLAVEGP